MSQHVSNICRSYSDLLVASLNPTTLVSAERLTTAVAFLMQQPDDSSPSSLNEEDEHLLGGYRRVFGGTLDDWEANRLLQFLGWVQF